MENVLHLLKLLFTDPKQAMYQAREEENRRATMILAVLGILLPGLVFLSSPLGLSFGIAFGLAHFTVYVLSIFLSGQFTGGTGSFTDILQICGLVWLPVGLVAALTKIMGLGLLGTLFGWIVLYYAVLVGHSFNGFNDVKLALAISLVINFLGGFAATQTLAKLARAILGAQS